jgi:hypothetical protein
MSYVTQEEFKNYKFNQTNFNNLLLTQDFDSRELIQKNTDLAKSLTTTNRNLFQKLDSQHRLELHSIFNDAKNHRDSNTEKIINVRKDIVQLYQNHKDQESRISKNSQKIGLTSNSKCGMFDLQCHFKKLTQTLGTAGLIAGVGVIGYYLIKRKRGK